MKLQLERQIAEVLQRYIGRETHVLALQSLGGGSINSAYRVQTNFGDYFLKHNDAERHPGMFAAEARGLELLAASHTLRIPYAIASGEMGDQEFLLLEFLSCGKIISGFWEDFGAGLAQMHRCTQAQFGLDHSNYMGSLPQENKLHDDFISFFINCRLQPQLELSIGHKTMRSLIPDFEALYRRLPELIPAEQPSLVHGDLWNGNFLVGPEGKACLIDPAVSYSHRECDIAMTRLFGGFDPEFYAAYHAALPLEKGWEERVDLFNLYPLLVHVNLFGGGYVQQVATIVRRYA